MEGVGQSVNRMTDYSTAVYRPNLEAAQQYQDFIARSLLTHGIIIQNIQSKNGQLLGENLLGLEIKLDRHFEHTRNHFVPPMSFLIHVPEQLCVGGWLGCSLATL